MSRAQGCEFENRSAAAILWARLAWAATAAIWVGDVLRLSSPLVAAHFPMKGLLRQRQPRTAQGHRCPLARIASGVLRTKCTQRRLHDSAARGQAARENATDGVVLLLPGLRARHHLLRPAGASCPPSSGRAFSPRSSLSSPPALFRRKSPCLAAGRRAASRSVYFSRRCPMATLPLALSNGPHKVCEAASE
jgi:hypothetical protein